MEHINIAATKSTPAVRFIHGVFIINGQSYPENALKFYQPVIHWVQEYLEQLHGTACFEFNLEYMNTSSSKCIMDLIDMLDSAFTNGKDIFINWYYDLDNESQLECAKEFREDVSIPFNIIPQEG